MFGTLRLLLAIFVMTSHIGIFVKIPGFSWFNQGISAVIGFYLVSGYLMKLIFSNKFENLLPNAKYFYLDRVVRIVPQYYVYLIITVLFLLITKYNPLIFNISAFISHLLVLPLNLTKWVNVNFFPWVTDYALIPPAWTLGTELQYYLLVPLLFTHRKTKTFAFIGSLLIAITAAFGVIDTNYYGVRFLAGLIFVFLTGAIIYDCKTDIKHQRQHQIKLIALWVGTLILTFILRIQGKMDVEYNAPVLYGYLVFMPLVYLLSKIPFRLKIDDLFGNLSYGVYLNHFLLIWAFNYFGWLVGDSTYEKYMRFFLLLPLSLLLSFFSYWLIDRRLKNVRLGFRGNHE